MKKAFSCRSTFSDFQSLQFQRGLCSQVRAQISNGEPWRAIWTSEDAAWMKPPETESHGEPRRATESHGEPRRATESHGEPQSISRLMFEFAPKAVARSREKKDQRSEAQAETSERDGLGG